MAKKKRIEEPEEARFEFPVFDEAGFISHETEQTFATAIALVLAILLGIVSYLIDWVVGPHAISVTPPLLYLPALVGLGTVATSPFLIARLRERSSEYSKGDWASLILIQLFGWLGIWFVLTDLLLPLPH